MTDTPTHPLAVENALLRGDLFLALQSLKRYAEAPHFEIEPDADGTPLLEVVVPESTRRRALEAIERAARRLQDEGRGI